MTAPMSAADRGRLAFSLVPVALELAGIVRGGGDAGTVADLLGSLTAMEMTAQPVVLAGMVPDDRTPAQLLAWVEWDEEGRPLPPNARMVLCTASRKPQPGQHDGEHCGTPWGYEKHRRSFEQPCNPCRDAFNAGRRERRRKAAREPEEGAA